MKKLLNILTSFSMISTFNFSLIACNLKDNDKDNNDPVQSEKNNLEKAKNFLSKGVTITDLLPGKSVKQYIEHIKATNETEIASDINFVFDDNYEEEIIAQQQKFNVTILLEDGEKTELVQFELNLSDKISIINNILNQAKSKITEVEGIGLIATDNITGNSIIEDRIIKLIENKVNNNSVKVKWSDESTLTSLLTERENKGKVVLTIVENDEDLKSETVDFNIINILDSEIAVHQQLIKDIEDRLKEIDVAQENIEEDIKLNDIEFKNRMNNLFEIIIDDSRVNATFNEEDATLKQKENQVSVNLSIGVDDSLVSKQIIVSLVNVLSSEKKKNEAILTKLKQDLTSIDGNGLTANLLITDKKIWDTIKQKIKKIVGDNDYAKIQVLAPFSLPSSSNVIQQVFNNVRNPNQNRRPTGQRPSGSQQTTGQRPLGSQTTGQRPLGSQTTGQKPLGSQTVGQKPLGSQTTAQKPLGSQTTGQKPSGSQTTGQKPSGSQTAGQKPSGSQEQTGMNPQASSTANQWSKTATLATTGNNVTVYLKIGSGKDKVQDLIIVKFNNVSQ